MASPYLTVLEIVNEVCDRMNVRRVTAATAGAYVVQVSNLRANSARLSLFNLQAAGTLSEAVQIRFAVLKATNT